MINRIKNFWKKLQSLGIVLGLYLNFIPVQTLNDKQVKELSEKMRQYWDSTWIVLGLYLDCTWIVLVQTLNDKQDKELSEKMGQYWDSTWIVLVKTLNDKQDKELSEKMRLLE